jgi:hypothetical protein
MKDMSEWPRRHDRPPGGVAAVKEIAIWLRAQLDVDEANAYEVHDRDCQSVVMTWTDWTTPTHAGPCDCGWPERMLAEIQAKRRMLDDVVPDATGLDMSVDGEFRVGSRDEKAEPYLGDILTRLLALPYAEQPGYREEWRP